MHRRPSFLVVLFAALLFACSSTAPDTNVAAGPAADAPDDDHQGLPQDPVPPTEPADPPPPDDVADAGGDAGAHDAAARHDAGTPPGPDACALVTPPKAPYLLYGLHPDASDALRSLGIAADGISQTIGNAAASAGTHAQDGVASGRPYSAATDIRVRGMTETQIRTLLGALAHVGFAGWYRKPGFDGWPASEAPHIHAVWVGAPMKRILRDQVRDWAVGKNGLVSHTTYKFYTWPQCARDVIVKRFHEHNPATG